MGHMNSNYMLREKKNLGILGGGQLARMIAMSAYNIGLGVYVYTNSYSDCAIEVIGKENSFIGDYSDIEMLSKFCESVDFITFEFENISDICLDFLIKMGKDNIFPNPSIIKICQDRIKEKEFLNSIGIPTAKYHIVDMKNMESLKDLLIDKKNLIIKTATLGYDGKGQYRININSIDPIKSAEDQIKYLKEELDSNLNLNLSNTNTRYITEEVERFSYEASIIVSRNRTGEISFFPIIRNIHENGILKYSISTHTPTYNNINNNIGNIEYNIQNIMKSYATKISENLDLIGILAIECFIKNNDDVSYSIIVNEMAPRPHNSGHCTMDSCNISQFEQLVSIIKDDINHQPILTTPCIMLNLLGSELVLKSNIDIQNDIQNNIKEPFIKECYNSAISIKKYDYGKLEIKNGRKMGHANILFSQIRTE